MTETAASPPALAVEDLAVRYRVRGGEREVLHGLSFTIGRGEAYGLVGESGCGKSTVAYATVGYLARNGRISQGRISVAGRALTGLGSEELRQLRATAVSMVYQDPGAALNPSLKIGRQMAEVYEYQRLSRREALDRAAEMLARVRIADPRRVLDRYPHQLSGGMQQRVCIAMALAINPALLILDEPTTGLDATVEAEVLDLVRQLRAEFNTSILCISHNLGVIAALCERVGVLYAGALVEEGSAAQIFAEPRHPYTVGLLRCLPQRGRRKDQGPLDTIPGFLPAPDQQIAGCIFADRCALADQLCRTTPPPLAELAGGRRSRCHYPEQAPDLPRTETALPAGSAPTASAVPLLKVTRLSKTFQLKGHALRAVQDLSLELRAGETLGLVGESGSGKTTFARLLLGLVAPDRADSIELDGRPLAGLLDQRSAADGRSLQIVFQNPDSALNRAHPVRRIIGRAIAKLSGLAAPARDERLLELTRAVRLPDRHLGAKPRQLSGGLKQRVAIARAFAGAPLLVVCDEPTSALDVSVQSAILNLFVELQARRQVSYIFISHDLGVVRFLADRIAVLYLGRLMEVGPAEQVFSGPHHPYTEALLSAVPTIDGRAGRRVRLTGEIPSASNPPSGCVFHTRCTRKLGSLCETEEPPLAAAGDGHVIHCHIPVAELKRQQSAPLDA